MTEAAVSPGRIAVVSRARPGVLELGQQAVYLARYRIGLGARRELRHGGSRCLGVALIAAYVVPATPAEWNPAWPGRLSASGARKAGCGRPGGLAVRRAVMDRALQAHAGSRNRPAAHGRQAH